MSTLKIVTVDQLPAIGQIVPNTLYLTRTVNNGFDLVISDADNIAHTFKRASQRLNEYVGVGELPPYQPTETLTEKRYNGKPVYRRSIEFIGDPYAELGLLELATIPDLETPVGNWLRKVDDIAVTTTWYDGTTLREQDLSGGDTSISAGVDFIRTTVVPYKVYGHTMTLLSDGRVLVMGGHPLSSAATNLCYIGTPDAYGTLSYVQTTNYPMNIAYHTATLLPDGRILAVGGYDGTAATRNTYLITVNGDGTLTFTPSTNYSSNTVYYHTATLLPDGRVLCTGGYYNGATSTVTRLLTVSGDAITYANGTSLPQAIYGHTATVLLDGRVFIAGGHSTTQVAINNTRIATIAANTISYIATAVLPGPLVHHCAVSILGYRLMLLGGYNGTASVDSCTIVSISGTVVNYSQVRPLLDQVHMAAAVKLNNNKITLTGGSINGTITQNAILSNDLGDVLLNHVLYFIRGTTLYCVNTGIPDSIDKIVYYLEYTKTTDTIDSAVAYIPGCYDKTSNMVIPTGNTVKGAEEFKLYLKLVTLPTTGLVVPIPSFNPLYDYMVDGGVLIDTATKNKIKIPNADVSINIDHVNGNIEIDNITAMSYSSYDVTLISITFTEDGIDWSQF